jgi:hypothetical protein
VTATIRITGRATFHFMAEAAEGVLIRWFDSLLQTGRGIRELAMKRRRKLSQQSYHGVGSKFHRTLTS